MLFIFVILNAVWSFLVPNEWNMEDSIEERSPMTIFI